MEIELSARSAEVTLLSMIAFESIEFAAILDLVTQAGPRESDTTSSRARCSVWITPGAIWKSVTAFSRSSSAPLAASVASPSSVL